MLEKSQKKTENEKVTKDPGTLKTWKAQFLARSWYSIIIGLNNHNFPQEESFQRIDLKIVNSSTLNKPK